MKAGLELNFKQTVNNRLDMNNKNVSQIIQHFRIIIII